MKKSQITALAGLDKRVTMITTRRKMEKKKLNRLPQSSRTNTIIMRMKRTSKGTMKKTMS